jgi:hypothetical protein
MDMNRFVSQGAHEVANGHSAGAQMLVAQCQCIGKILARRTGMRISRCQLILLACFSANTFFSASTLAAQTTVAHILSRPSPPPQDVANLESHVLESPEDIAARTQLLQLYLATAPLPPYDDPVRRAIRLQHILYLVGHHPEAPVCASKEAYVYRVKGPYASPADHDAVRAQWLASFQAHWGNSQVTLNAVKVLAMEDKDDAEIVLRRAMDAEPDNREIAANLGFLYAKEILGPDPASHARDELEQSSNAIVLSAAGMALANLSKSAPSIDGKTDRRIFNLASELSARARQLAPDDKDIPGTAMIKHFIAAQEGIGGAGWR